MALGTPYVMSAISPAPRVHAVLESWRIEHKMSCAEFCRFLKMKPQQYWRMGKSKNVMTKNALKYAETLGIDPCKVVAFINKQGDLIDADGNSLGGKSRLAPASAISKLLEKTFTEKQLRAIYHNSDTVKELLKVLQEKSA